jgi:hypothetical protein
MRSTLGLDRPVEAVISPVTPYAGVLPGKFYPSSKLHLLRGCTHGV